MAQVGREIRKCTCREKSEELFEPLDADIPEAVGCLTFVFGKVQN
jgi:hypothetical protein